MDIWIATGNHGKVREYERLFAPLKHKIFSLKDVLSFTAKPETGKTFLENAQQKARTLHAVKNNFWVLGEDSGLEVEGLNGMPGIYSARYAGDHAKDIENYTKVLKMLTLKNAQTRNAAFKCTIVAISPEKKEYIFEGVLKGTISPLPRGTEGFGYDPIFIPEGEQKTIAELGLAYKNKTSHRARAIEKMFEDLKGSF